MVVWANAHTVWNAHSKALSAASVNSFRARLRQRETKPNLLVALTMRAIKMHVGVVRLKMGVPRAFTRAFHNKSLFSPRISPEQFFFTSGFPWTIFENAWIWREFSSCLHSMKLFVFGLFVTNNSKYMSAASMYRAYAKCFCSNVIIKWMECQSWCWAHLIPTVFRTLAAEHHFIQFSSTGSYRRGANFQYPKNGRIWTKVTRK